MILFIDGRLQFGISQQEFLQAVLPVQLAALYVTITGKLPAPPEGDNEGVYYLSGPAVIDLDDIPFHPTRSRFVAALVSPSVVQRRLTLSGSEDTQCPCVRIGRKSVWVVFSTEYVNHG
jgi:hypothetical protein